MARMKTSLKALHRPEKKKSSWMGKTVLAFALVATPIVYHFVSSRTSLSSSVTLADARTNSSVRQRFLNALVTKGEIPGCAGIVYDHEGDRIISYLQQQALLAEQITGFTGSRQLVGGELDSFKAGNYDVKTPDVLELSGQGRSVPIFVGRQFFESKECSYLTAPEMHAVLVYHEGEHVRQHREGFSSLNKREICEGLEQKTLEPRVLYEAYEYDARTRELPRVLASSSLSWYYQNDTKARFIASGFFLTQSSKDASLLQQKLIERLQNTVAQQPLLRDVSIDRRYFQARRELMK